jgi:DNA primase large subunit
VFGKEYLDLTPFDTEAITKSYDGLNLSPEINKGIGLGTIKTDNFPPCIKFLMTERFIGHRKRFILILYFRELGLPISDTIALLRKCLDPKTFIHCVMQERQPLWIYRRTDLTFPSCQTLQSQGFCTDSTCKGARLY